MTTVYLIHFDPPYRHMRHYIGATNKTALERFREHVTGNGARLTRQALKAGSRLQLAYTWDNVTWEFERKLKGRGASHLCPICNQGARDLPAERG